MAIRYGERQQTLMFPPSIEELIPADAPVRAYDAFVNALDLPTLGVIGDEQQAGRPSYDPAAMLKLLLYGVSYGVRSSRKLERECHYNLAFIWLMGGLKPDHHTISEFRRRHRKALAQVIKQCARLCLTYGLIEGNVLFIDGTRMRANASLDHNWTPQKAQKVLEELDARIEQALQQGEQDDQEQAQQGSWVKLPENLADREQMRDRVAAILEQMRLEGRDRLNTTDPDSVLVKSRQGIHPGYNGEVVTDAKHGLIADSDVVSASTDIGQFTAHIAQAQETLGKSCQTACGDAGYSDAEDLAPLDENGVDIIVPSQMQAEEKTPGPFHKSQFQYDETSDSYVCPIGERLTYGGYEKARSRRYYKGGKVCLTCPHFGVCTTDRVNGRKVTRDDYEALRAKLAERYASPGGQAIYARRKEKTEPIFGHFKRNLGAGYFLLRGVEKVRAEFSLLAVAYNVRRLISLLGVAGLIGKLTS